MKQVIQRRMAAIEAALSSKPANGIYQRALEALSDAHLVALGALQNALKEDPTYLPTVLQATALDAWRARCRDLGNETVSR